MRHHLLAKAVLELGISISIECASSYIVFVLVRAEQCAALTS